MKVVTVFILILAVIISVNSFKINTEGHKGVTDEALRELGFCRNARDIIIDSVLLTDIFEQFTSSAHFDDESIKEGSRRLLEQKSTVINILGDIEDADDDDLFFDDILEGLDLFGLVFYSEKDEILEEAWFELGRGLHPLQDFYSHSNWLEMGNTITNPELGINEMDSPDPNSQPCFVDNPGVLNFEADGNTLTTSYFIFSLSRHCDLEEYPGKCIHGWDLAGCPDGLNKDEPSRPGYTDARVLAIDATKKYVQELLNDIEEKYEDNDDLRNEIIDSFLGGRDCQNELVSNYSSIYIQKEEVFASSCRSISIDFNEDFGSDFLLQILSKNYDSITVATPDGSELDDEDIFEVFEDREGIVYSLGDNPDNGIYDIEICTNDDGSSWEYTVNLFSFSTVIFRQYVFTKLANPRNPVSYPIHVDANPLLDTPQDAIAEMYGPVDSNNFQIDFVSASNPNNVLQSDVPMEVTVSFNDGMNLVSPSSGLNLPEGKFYVRITGFTSEGSGDGSFSNSFVRFYPRVYDPQPLSVSSSGEVSTFQFGPDSEDSLVFPFVVQNLESFEQTYSVLAEMADTRDQDFDVQIELVNPTSKKSSIINPEDYDTPYEREFAVRYNKHQIPFPSAKSHTRPVQQVRKNLKKYNINNNDDIEVHSFSTRNSDSFTLTLSSNQIQNLNVLVSLRDSHKLNTNQLLNLYVTANSGTGNSNLDVITGEYVGCGGDPVCNNAGVCYQGECQCITGFTGSECNNDESSSSSSSTLQFNFFIISLFSSSLLVFSFYFFI
eukprot:TRINITY_DN3092_c0_g1_i1.p1 TRINITY_DN3092_c0_g1~~TRINITY_DN3092_c0_g1_i1.p1  ORF type:complete len:777 (+),score=278.62 TRINITY_DN3092_c0_g1_i1:45-2375(+)